MTKTVIKKMIGGKEITLETGIMAKQANGAVLVRQGANAVLVTACMSPEPLEGTDFFPLTVNYIEKMYAAGKIPGGYIKREGKPSEREILTSRLIDRPIRPLFPENFYYEVQIFATALSSDQIYSTDILSMIGASAALSISDIPFLEPVGGVRIAYLNGEYIINPSQEEIENAEMDMIVGGTKGGITMVEGGSKEVSKDILLGALEIAQQNINEIIDFVNELVALIKPEKMVVEEAIKLLDDAKKKEISDYAYPIIKSLMVNANKKERSKKIDEAIKEIFAKYEIDKEHELYREVKTLLNEIEVEIFRKMVIDENTRPDGRKNTEIRPITVEVDVLESVHGSALFTRGQTQSLGIVTLGSGDDVQYVDGLDVSGQKRFMLHYNFPPFSTGEVKRYGMVSRREIGHGHLATRAIEAVLPNDKDFPYTIRVVSEVLESNGSSSMATVCSSCLSLMATGVPVKSVVGGIAMGLIWDKDAGKYMVLSDIQGLEDHHGDMDFKIAGSKDGITAFQMDVKTIGITKEIMTNAIDQALEGLNFILGKMIEVIPGPRSELSANAPKIVSLMIPESEIGTVIGSGGRTIKKIMKETTSEISINDSGEVIVTAKNEEGLNQAKFIIEHLINGFKKGDNLEGVVTRIEDYGVFIELVPGQTGLLHKSRMKERKNPKDRFNMGDKVTVVVSDIDDRKRISLTEE